jgi:hypothetical protein
MEHLRFTSIFLTILGIILLFGIGLGIVAAGGPNPERLILSMVATLTATLIALVIVEWVVHLAVAAGNELLKVSGDSIIWLINRAFPLKSPTDDPRRLYWEKKLRRLLKREEREAQ